MVTLFVTLSSILCILNISATHSGVTASIFIHSLWIDRSVVNVGKSHWDWNRSYDLSDIHTHAHTHTRRVRGLHWQECVNTQVNNSISGYLPSVRHDGQAPHVDSPLMHHHTYSRILSWALWRFKPLSICLLQSCLQHRSHVQWSLIMKNWWRYLIFHWFQLVMIFFF